ncbi:MAG: hypothetical protein ACRDHF_14535 [Tepidiformaceae bacterium]
MMWRAVSLALSLAWLALLPQDMASAGDNGVVTATVTVAADVWVEVVVPERKVKAGNPFQVEARIYAEEGGTGSIALRHPGTLFVRGGDTPLPVVIRPGTPTVVRWSACAETAGRHVLMASFEGAGGVIESNAEVVEVAGKKKVACPPPWQ